MLKVVRGGTDDKIQFIEYPGLRIGVSFHDSIEDAEATLMNASTTASHLAASVARLADHLLGKPSTRYRHEWRYRRHGSLRVTIAGPTRGRFSDFEADVHGDALDLVKHILKLDTGAAIQWSKRFLGVDEFTTAPSFRGNRDAASTATGTIDARKSKALKVWDRARPITNTLGERYLRQVRGIPGFVIPPSLRFGQAVYHHESKRAWPAIVAGLTRSDQWRVEAVHVIFLDPNTGTKAPIAPVKKSFGPISGAAVRFGPTRTRIALAEGIETAFSIYETVPGLTVWATVGTSGLRRVELSPDMSEVLICADADEAGRRAARAAARRFLSQGRKVLIADPPCGGNDFNDPLQAAMGTATK